MSELPWFKFIIAHWMLDRNLAKCSSATRGVWLELIIAMHQDGRSGELRETADHLALLTRTTTAIMSQALTELQATGTADVTFRNEIVTVVNRKMKREAKVKTGTALRVKKHRSNKNVTPHVTAQSREVRVESREEKVKKEKAATHTALIPEMVAAFLKKFPAYPPDDAKDFDACLEIAYAIGGKMNLTQHQILVDKKPLILSEWGKAIEYVSTDQWYRKKSLSGICGQWQALVMAMNSAIEPVGASSAPTLTAREKRDQQIHAQHATK